MDKRHELFLDALTDYLTSNEAEMSIKLQMGKPEAKMWAALRSASPLVGYHPYPDNKLAKETLRKFFGWDEEGSVPADGEKGKTEVK